MEISIDRSLFRLGLRSIPTWTAVYSDLDRGLFRLGTRSILTWTAVYSVLGHGPFLLGPRYILIWTAVIITNIIPFKYLMKEFSILKGVN